MFDLLQALPSKKELRPHQVEAIARLKSSLGKGNRRVVLQGPVGFGKTLVAARILEGALSKGNTAIFTAPMISLIDQTVKAFEAEGIRDIGVMQGNHPRRDPMAKVQIASVQTLARREIPQAALIIVDEAHIRSEVIDRLMDARPDVFFIGLTATPWAKGMGLRWQDLIVPCTLSGLVESGYLSRSRVFAPHVPNLTGVRTIAGDYAETQLAAVMGDAQVMGSVVDTWLERGGDRPTLVFGVNRNHAQAMHAAFERAGVASAYVDGESDRIEREVIGRQFKAGEIRVICSVRTMTTGVDLPVSCIVDAAPTKSRILHMQKIGRGLRINPGTEDLLVLDHAGNAIRLGLVEDLHQDRLDDSKPKEKQKREPVTEKLPKPCSKCETLFTGKICPSCGHERKPRGPEAADGELVELTGRKDRKVEPTMAEKDRFWRMALWLDNHRGRGGKLAKGLYKGRFGVWPRGLSHEPMAPDQAFMNYEKSRRIAYAKKRRESAEARA